MPKTRSLRACLNVALAFTTSLSLLALSLQLALAESPQAHRPVSQPDFGPNVLLFDPSMPSADIQAQIDKVYAIQQHSEFGSARYALLFLPGEYHVDVPVGFYTQVLGLGATPDAVHITGNVHSDASLPHNNATCTFWRGVEGFSVTPTGRHHAVGRLAGRALPPHARSRQHRAASERRMGQRRLDVRLRSSTATSSGPQQQWISRNSEWGSWTGANWNMVFVGIPHPPAGEWPQPPYTKVERTPVVREKPFLEVDAKGNWSVRVPALQTRQPRASPGTAASRPDATSPQPFYIAHADEDTAATINAQLAKARICCSRRASTISRAHSRHPARHGRPRPRLRHAAPHQRHRGHDHRRRGWHHIAGMLFDAGAANLSGALEIGPTAAIASPREESHLPARCFLPRWRSRRGQRQGQSRINCNDTIIDHTWIWRADHGSGVGWTSNLSDNGLVVNGDNVTAYGLFVEHHQQFQVLWNGNARPHLLLSIRDSLRSARPGRATPALLA